MRNASTKGGQALFLYGKIDLEMECLFRNGKTEGSDEIPSFHRILAGSRRRVHMKKSSSFSGIRNWLFCQPVAGPPWAEKEDGRS